MADRYTRVWQRIREHAGEDFSLPSGRAFSFEIRGGMIHTDRGAQPIPSQAVREALWELPLRSPQQLGHLTEPHVLFAILTDPRILPGR